MKRFLKYTVAFCVIFVSGFILGKQYKMHRVEIRTNPYTTVKDVPIEENKPFVVIIPSYNNAQWVERNLFSALNQDYENFRIIYIDDCSSDRTSEKVREILQKTNRRRISYIRNRKRQGAIANLYQAIHSCQDKEIVVTLDGDDWFSHENVLKTLNGYYADPDVWLTYGQYMDYPSYEKGLCRSFTRSEVERKGFRNAEWVASHPRTFYAGLFKKIRLQDLFYNGKWAEMGWDLSMMLPMLEMAKDHHLFVPDVLYMYNQSNPISDGKVNRRLQIEVGDFVRSLPSYQMLKNSPYKSVGEKSTMAQVVVFSEDQPLRLFSCLESIHQFVRDVEHLCVLYQASDEQYEKCYREVAIAFPGTEFKRIEKPFKETLLNTLSSGKSNFVLFAKDEMLIKDYVLLRECIQKLEKTKAHGFFLSLGDHIQDQTAYLVDCVVPTEYVEPNILTWQFSHGVGDWEGSKLLEMVLLEKETICRELKQMDFDSPDLLEKNWIKQFEKREVGLFFDTSLSVRVKFPEEQYSSEELLNRFNQGFKMNLMPIYQLKNQSTSVFIEPQFTYRKIKYAQ